jgi:hypothetical protein
LCGQNPVAESRRWGSNATRMERRPPIVVDLRYYYPKIHILALVSPSTTTAVTTTQREERPLVVAKERSIRSYLRIFDELLSGCCDR